MGYHDRHGAVPGLTDIMSETTPSRIVALLHCELPSSGESLAALPGVGTVDLAEVEGEGLAVRETIPLSEGQGFRIGRVTANDLVIDNPSVSRFHAVLSASSNGVVLSDLSSLNGTQVNGRRISAPVDLANGDVLQIAAVRITVEMSRCAQPGRDAEIPIPEDDTLLGTCAAKLSTVIVTVLLADVCGFTRLSQHLPPHDVAEMLNHWFRKVARIIAAHNGEIDKYIGDCVMALWRSERLSPEQSALQATRAAQQILAETEELSQGSAWKYQQEYPWSCRVALNTGEALMGSIGSSSSVRDHTVLGDTVNTAFRLESSASSGGPALLISEHTAMLIRNDIPLRSLGEVILEGRRDNLEIYTLNETDTE
jgi:adenylate cyclase